MDEYSLSVLAEFEVVVRGERLTAALTVEHCMEVPYAEALELAATDQPD